MSRAAHTGLPGGKQLFADGTVPTALAPVEIVTFPNGTVRTVYDVVGPA